MAKAIREGLETKLAALAGDEWDSMSESDDDITSEPPPISLQKNGGNDRGKHERGKKNDNGKTGHREGASAETGQPSSVIYIGHIPHGFYEEAMNGFFSQFGDVTACRVSRSKMTARSKGYGFVQFSSPEVAQIVAETMDGYFLLEKQLVVKVMRQSDVHPALFKGAGKEFEKVDWHNINRLKFNKDRNAEQVVRNTKTLLKKDNARRKKFAELGIEFDFPGFQASLCERREKATALLKASAKAEGGGGTGGVGGGEKEKVPTMEQASSGRGQETGVEAVKKQLGSEKQSKKRASPSASLNEDLSEGVEGQGGGGGGTRTPKKRAKREEKVHHEVAAMAAEGEGGEASGAGCPNPKKKTPVKAKAGPKTVGGQTRTPLKAGQGGDGALGAEFGGKAKVDPVLANPRASTKKSGEREGGKVPPSADHGAGGRTPVKSGPKGVKKTPSKPSKTPAKTPRRTPITTSSSAKAVRKAGSEGASSPAPSGEGSREGGKLAPGTPKEKGPKSLSVSAPREMTPSKSPKSAQKTPVGKKRGPNGEGDSVTRRGEGGGGGGGAAVVTPNKTAKTLKSRKGKGRKA